MSKEVIMQFVGYTVKPLGREYTFMVREPPIEPREFTIAIANEAFTERRLRFQDGPDICSAKLRRELLNGANLSPESHFDLSNAELADYHASHSAPRRSAFSRRTPARPDNS